MVCAGDIANFDAIRHAIENRPDVVFNATAYIAVDLAKTEQEQANVVNHLAVENLAKVCKEHDILVVHYSTDYVFDGTGITAWQENDQTALVIIMGKPSVQNRSHCKTVRFALLISARAGSMHYAGIILLKLC